MPSELHNTLAEMAFKWLANKATGRGVRGGFEVPLADGYVADAVALCTFQWRHATKYIGKDHIHQTRMTWEVPECVCVFESKASRADFLSTFGPSDKHANRAEPVGHFHWCVCARGIAEPEELPEFWGMLSPRGIGLGELRQPRYCGVDPKELPDDVIQAAAYSILWYAKNNANRHGYRSATYDNLDH